MSIDTKYFKKILEEELDKLTGELKSVGRLKEGSSNDWEALPEDVVDRSEADPNTTADHIEDYETNISIVRELEARFYNVKEALKRIEDGTYGICKKGGEEISENRLRANPAAQNCIAHE
jgi:RNA polymerase-binding transcription factor DksA